MGSQTPTAESPAGLAPTARHVSIKPAVKGSPLKPTALAIEESTVPAKGTPQKVASPNWALASRSTLNSRIRMGSWINSGRQPEAGLTLFSL